MSDTQEYNVLFSRANYDKFCDICKRRIPHGDRHWKKTLKSEDDLHPKMRTVIREHTNCEEYTHELTREQVHIKKKLKELDKREQRLYSSNSKRS